MDNEEVIAFYDPFYSKKENVRINERIFFLFKQMKIAGLSKHSSVVELGCGAGPLTFLISKFVTKGIVEAVDFSSAAIMIAKKNIQAKNIFFYEQDILSFMPAIVKKADFITLFDVLEHVPVEKHDTLIASIAQFMHAESYLLINIPNPRHIEYDQLHHPAELQVIDQPLPLDHINKILVKYGLLIQCMKIHGVWNENDYQFFVVKKDRPYLPVPLKKTLSFYQRLKRRIERDFVRLVHKYPGKG